MWETWQQALALLAVMVASFVLGMCEAYRRFAPTEAEKASGKK